MLGFLGRVGLHFYSTTSLWTPALLFAAGEPGVWYDPSDFSTMFTDAAGTTPVTAVEQPVGLLLDKSKGLALGAELVTNGDFSSGTTGWESGSGNQTLTVVGGEAKSEVTTATSISLLYRPVAFATSGVFYKVEFDVYSPNYSGLIRCSLNDSSSGGFSFTTTVTTTKTRITSYLTAGPTPKLWITSSPSALSLGSIVYFDNISVREVTGNHASQSTAASRPVLSARVNALVQTEDVSNASWFKSGATAAASVLTATAGAGRHQVRQGIFTSATAKASIQFSPGTHLYAHLCFYDGGAVYATAIYQLQGAGTVSQTANSSGTVSSSTITLNANGSYTCTLSTTLTSAPVLNLSVGFAQQATGNTIDSSGIPTFTAAGTETISATYADARVTNVGSNMPAYQRVGAATYGTSTVAGNPDYDTTGFPLFLAFNGSTGSRWMVSSTITPGTDKAQVFAGVRKLSDAAEGFITELSDTLNVGTFRIYAPRSGTTNFSWRTGGSSFSEAAATYPAPITAVATGIGDILTDVSILRVNGVQAAANSADQGTGIFGNYPLYIGARAGTSGYYDGNLYSLIVRFGTNLPEATIDQTEVWVGDKTGLNLSFATQQTIFDRFNATVLNRLSDIILQRY